ncbi:DNA binding protein [Fragilaria crotonensis]|nr:DNA binding protein [Fragilaria crotonensis]
MTSDSEDDNGEPVNKGAYRKGRRRFTIQEKAAIIRTVERLMQQHGMTRREACEDLNITSGMHWAWKQKIDAMLETKKNNIKAKCIHRGKDSCLTAHKQELLQFIFELREQGMAVSVRMVAVRAAQLSEQFHMKSRDAQYHSARRFIRSQGLVFRLGTNESQRSPAQVAAEALDYIQNVARPKVSQEGGRHEDFILNMDQTPIPFTYNAKKTLEIVGRRTVHIRKSTGDTKRATFAMTVTASGKILKPLLIFKGARNGRIVQREFPNYENDMIYLCQQNAWMDEEAMIVWVEQVLRPHIETAPAGILPILFLDSYRCHMMASVVGMIQDLGVEVEHIPGVQQWEEWMIAEGLANGTTSPPTRENIIEWTRIATNSMPSQMIKNAWRHGEYSWFPQAPAAEGPPAVVNAEEAIPAVLDEIERREEESEDEEGDVDSTDTE